MKKSFIIQIMIMFIIMFMTTIPLEAQATVTKWNANTTQANVGDEKGILFDCVIRNTDTLYSSTFNLANYNYVLSTARYFVSDSGTSVPKIKVLRQESWYDGIWNTAKTYCTADSVETVQTIADTLLTPKNRLVIIGAAANPVDTRVRFKINTVRVYPLRK